MESGVAEHGSAEAVELDEQLRRHSSRGDVTDPSPERSGGEEFEGYETAEEGGGNGKRRSGVSARAGQQRWKRFSKRDSRSGAKMETVEVVEIDEKERELQDKGLGQGQQGQSRGSVGKAL